MKDSIFTKIINGEIPCHKIYEDDHVLAFLDIHPIKPGHTLVVPKQQIDQFDELPIDTRDALLTAAQKISKALRTHFNTKRTALMVFGYDVEHAHIHLVPSDDGQSIYTSLLNQDMTTEPDHAALAAMASEIRKVV